MSVKALVWALDARQTGKLSAEHRLVLVALADHADPEGRGAWCSVPTIARRLGITVRSVRRSVSALEDDGLIRTGDQRLVAHVRKDRRPVVWDLALDGRQTYLLDDGQVGAEPYDRGVHGVTPLAPRESARGDAGGSHGVTPASPKPKTEPNPLTHLPLDTSPSARASLPMAEPRERGRGRLRALGLTDAHCPTCGERIHRTHTCRKSALSPVPVEPRPVIPDPIVVRQPPAAELLLPLEDHDPCAMCGTTEAHRPLVNGTGHCARCYVMGVRSGSIESTDNGAEDGEQQ